MRRLACQRCHGERVPVTANIAEQFQIGVGVHNQPKATHVIANRHAHVNQSPTIHPNARMIRIWFADHSEFTKEIDCEGLQLEKVFARRQPEPVKREHRVARNLPGNVEHDATATTDPAHRPTTSVEVFGAGANVRSAPFAANADSRRMIAQDQGSRGSVAADVVYQSALKGEQGIERQGAEQIRG